MCAFSLTHSTSCPSSSYKHVARIHADAFISSSQRGFAAACTKCGRSGFEECFVGSGTDSLPYLTSLPCLFDLYFLISQEGSRQVEYSTRWLSLNAEAKAKIKQDALLTLGSPSQKAGNFASQVVASIAAVELPQGQWPDLIELLLGFVNNQPNTNLKISTLQTIGFICETIVRLFPVLPLRDCTYLSILET